jgi:ABC-2 type transport system permease protein
LTELHAAVNDGLIMTWRNLKRVPRIPELAIFAILQSIMFVLLFAYVFGGAIPLPDGGSYREYLMPGIYIQTLGFASITTAIAVTDDMAKGLIDRFRSLPMARSAVLSGRTVSDVVYNAGILVVLMLSGLVVGWRVHGTVGEFLFACALMLFFTFAMAWIGVLRTRTCRAGRASIRSSSRSSGRSACWSSSPRSPCGSTARSTARRRDEGPEDVSEHSLGAR